MRIFYAPFFILFRKPGLTLVALALLLINTASAQLNISTAMTPTQLVQNVLVGSGVTVSGVTYTGSANARGSFTNGNTTTLGFADGLILATGNVTDIDQPASSFASTDLAMPGDPDLEALIGSGNSSNDASVLAFNFIPLADTIKFRYKFGSEEYPEFVGTSYNDVFGFFLTGPNPLGGNYLNKNIALIPGTSTPVSINNVNNGSGNLGPCQNCAYYIDNSASGTIVYDGTTKILTAWALVVPCVQYHIKLAIADVGDGIYDSGVFLEGNSFSSNAVTISTYYTTPQAGTDAVEGCNDAIISFRLPAVTPSPFPINYTIHGTATNGVDYTTIPVGVTIPAGQDSVTVTIHPIVDGITEGTETVQLIFQTSICGGYDTVSVNIIDNIPISLTSSNDTTLCGGSATICTTPAGGIQPYTYNWSYGAGTTSCVTVSPGNTTTYTISVTDICNTLATDDVIVYIGTGSANAGNDTSMCVGQQMTLVATGGTGYLWSTGATTGLISVSPTVTTTYYVTVYGTCNAYDSVVVTVNPSPVVTASVSPSSIYMGDQAYLSAVGAASFSWTSLPPDPTLSGQSNSANPVVSPPVTTIYLVTGTDPNGCQANDTVTLIVIPIFPLPDFTSNIRSGCEPLTVQFYDQSTKVAPGASYFWNFGNGTTSTSINPVAYFADAGKYDISLTVTNPGGYTGSITASQYIEVYPNPIARYVVTPGNDISILEPVINFFDQSIGNPVHWFWTFGDGRYDTIQNPQHIYSDEDTATYQVSLIITTEHGCVDTTGYNVVVRPAWALYMPTAFSPNNDGHNDWYFVSGFGIYEKDFELTIFNRWGQMIYRSNDIEKGWDGKFNGQLAPPGTYIATVSFRDFLSRKHKQEKPVVLVH